MQFLDRVKVAITTIGTGTVTVGAVSTPAFCTPAEAGATNGIVSRWILEEGTDFEIFQGTYSSTGPTVSRDTVELSRIGGVAGTTKMTLAGGATLRAIISALDIPVNSYDDGLITGAVTITEDYGSV